LRSRISFPPLRHPPGLRAWIASVASAVCFGCGHAALGADQPPAAGEPAEATPALYLPPENPADLLRMNPEMQCFFDQHVTARAPSAEALREIVGAIVRAEGLGFTYDGFGTFDPGETFRRRRGNCLSFSLLVTAVARAYGFKTAFWQIAQPERWNRVGDIIASMQHVNVRVETDDGSYIVDLRPDLVSASGGEAATALTDQRAAAYFYSDVGFGHLVQGRTTEARRGMVTATQVDPQCASVWANLATLHSRLGELAQARTCYERSLQLDRRGLNVLVGLVSVLERLGTPEDLRLARELERRAQRLMDRNPYYHQHLARVASDRADWSTAEKELRRAIDLKDDEPEFYEQWIASLQQLGRDDAARRAAAKLEKLRARQGSQSARIVP
jgi:Flp pilus assembly protein TadD